MRERERDREHERAIFYLLGPSQDLCNKGWARPNPVAQNFILVSHRSGRELRMRATNRCLPACSGPGSCIGNTAGIRTLEPWNSDLGHRHIQWVSTCCTTMPVLVIFWREIQFRWISVQFWKDASLFSLLQHFCWDVDVHLLMLFSHSFSLSAWKFF